MPTLNGITCYIERSPQDVPLHEYEPVYGDRVVSTHVQVPKTSAFFSVHLFSNGYIADGLAMFVFIDGVPQCNRNRQGLVKPGEKTERHEYEVNFRVRQKEDLNGDGTFTARPWEFKQLHTGKYSSLQGSDAQDSNIGTIEVVVLRCTEGQRSSQSYTLPERRKPDGKKSKKEESAKAKTSPKAPAKATSDTSKGGDFVSGLLGLFDGAGDAWDDTQKPHSPFDTLHRPSGSNAAINGNGVNKSGYATPPKPAWDTTHGYGTGSYAGHGGLNETPNVTQTPQNTNAAAVHWETPNKDDQAFKGPNTGWAAPEGEKKNNAGGWGDNNPGNNQAWETNTNNNNWDNNAGNDNTWASNRAPDTGNNNGNWDNGPVQTSNGAKDDNKAWESGKAGDQGNTGWNQSTGWSDDKRADPDKTNGNGSKQQSAGLPAVAGHSHNGMQQGVIDPSRPHIKPYWSDWKRKPSQVSEAEQKKMDRVYTEPEEPIARLSAQTVEQEKLSHQVQAGRGTRYAHSITRPKYVDSMRHPYAVFVFKYRSAAMLEKIHGPDVAKKENTIKRNYKQRMLAASKEEVVQELMRVKKKGGYGTDSSLESDSEGDSKKGVAADKASNIKEEKQQSSGWNNDNKDNTWSQGAAATEQANPRNTTW